MLSIRSKKKKNPRVCVLPSVRRTAGTCGERVGGRKADCYWLGEAPFGFNELTKKG